MGKGRQICVNAFNKKTFVADLLERPATDWQSGNDNVSQERLDDHGEV